MESLLLPSKIRFAKGDRPNVGVLTVEPFAKGYGTTIGNSLRRVLLSSLPGASVTAVKIKGADHEFATMPNIKEDVLEIILNLKSLRLKCHSEEPVKLKLSAKGEENVTAEAFEKNADVEIMNPELVIATLTDKSASIEMEITIEQGRGYRTTDERGKEKLDLGTIAVDALYNPVLSASYKVEETRLGDRTDYDKLVLTVETDGSMDAIDACRTAVTVLLDHLNLLKDLEYEA
ncbi:DNA-directed RNA polymerase subunit alpha [Patescibacteria group bacterium]|jgi:DNA-directed RNA polymerase subunit alpha|nr:DNA-directed RNA polymerase subunit alpha [Patescibacteria group bacterium]